VEGGKNLKVILEAKGLVKKFGGLIAVDNFDISVEEKSIHALIGPNGAGKTTVFNLIMGDIRKDAGQIFYDGKDISEYPVYKKIRMGISRTYQLLRLFPGFTILENIALPLIERMGMTKDVIDNAKSLAAEFGIEKYLLMYPNELSLGNLRKVELCRALITKPKLILCDELYSGLTFGEIEELNNKIKSLNEAGLTFLIIDHNIKGLKPIVNKVSVINFGKKIAEGSFEEVVNNPVVQKAYLGG
jgi:branched-chain amino acid transport system ATP-binding protein